MDKLIHPEVLSPEEMLKRRRAALVPYSPWLRMLRFTLGWLFNITLFAIIALVNLVYGATFGAPAFKVVALSRTVYHGRS